MDLTNLQWQLKKAMLSLDIHQKEQLVDSQKVFHIFFVETMKTLAKLTLLGIK